MLSKRCANWSACVPVIHSSEATLSLTQGGITRGARRSTSHCFYLNYFHRKVRGSANNVLNAQYTSVEALQ